MSCIDDKTAERIFREEIREGMKQVVRKMALKEKIFLSSKEVEEIYGIPATTLARLRRGNHGPDYRRADRKIFYTHEAIKNYLKEAKSRA